MSSGDPLGVSGAVDPALGALAELSQVDFTQVGRPAPDPEKLKRRLLKPLASHPDEYVLSLDNSSMEKFNTCPRAAEYYLIERREAPLSSALVFGQAFHKALELYYTGKGDDGMEAIYKHFQQSPPAFADWRTADLCCTSYEKYQQRYPLCQEPFRIPRIGPDGYESEDGELAVELPFQVPIGSTLVEDTFKRPAHKLIEGRTDDEFPYIKRIHFVWTGKIDLIAITPDGLWWVHDHKTSSIGGPSYTKQFYLSQQMLGYTYAGQRVLHHPIRGLHLNAVICRKPTKTGVGFDYVRERIHYTKFQLEEFVKNISAIVDEIINQLVEGLFPMKTAWCTGKYGTCTYFDACNLDSDEQKLIYLQSDNFDPVTWSPLDD